MVDHEQGGEPDASATKATVILVTKYPAPNRCTSPAAKPRAAAAAAAWEIRRGDQWAPEDPLSLHSTDLRCRCKTRLAATIGAEPAASFARAALLDLLDRFSQPLGAADTGEAVHRVLLFAPLDREADFRDMLLSLGPRVAAKFLPLPSHLPHAHACPCLRNAPKRMPTAQSALSSQRARRGGRWALQPMKGSSSTGNQPGEAHALPLNPMPAPTSGERSLHAAAAAASGSPLPHGRGQTSGTFCARR